jgi:hypothetical protein
LNNGNTQMFDTKGNIQRKKAASKSTKKPENIAGLV